MSDEFTPTQIQQLRLVLREELADAGLRIDGPEHVDDAREDFRFLRRLRENWDGASKKVGNTILGAIVSLLLAVLGAGFWAWISTKGK